MFGFKTKEEKFAALNDIRTEIKIPTDIDIERIVDWFDKRRGLSINTAINKQHKKVILTPNKK